MGQERRKACSSVRQRLDCGEEERREESGTPLGIPAIIMSKRITRMIKNQTDTNQRMVWRTEAFVLKYLKYSPSSSSCQAQM